MIKNNIPSHWSQDTYIKAYRFAAEAHNGQLVPGTTLPYLMHISMVAMEDNHQSLLTFSGG